MVDVQNATLAGGVAVGAVANLPIRPWGAFLVGSTAGTISAIGFAVIQPILEDAIGLHDTCGVHNLHGMPGVFGGFVSVLAAGAIADSDYGYVGASDGFIGVFFPGRVGHARSRGEQAGYQLAGLVCTLAIAIVGGTITGWILRLPFFSQPRDLFTDSEQWHTPSEEIPFYHGVGSDQDVEMTRTRNSTVNTQAHLLNGNGFHYTDGADSRNGSSPNLLKLRQAYDTLDSPASNANANGRV